MSYMLDQIVNCRVCNAGIPEGYEVAAVVDAMIDIWGDFICIEATAKHGVSGFDREIIEGIISRYGLSCTVDDVVQELVAECRARVNKEKENGEEET